MGLEDWVIHIQGEGFSLWMIPLDLKEVFDKLKKLGEIE